MSAKKYLKEEWRSSFVVGLIQDTESSSNARIAGITNGYQERGEELKGRAWRERREGKGKSVRESELNEECQERGRRLGGYGRVRREQEGGGRREGGGMEGGRREVGEGEEEGHTAVIRHLAQYFNVHGRRLSFHYCYLREV
jgi:hypothetical protein